MLPLCRGLLTLSQVRRCDVLCLALKALEMFDAHCSALMALRKMLCALLKLCGPEDQDLLCTA